MTEFGIRSRVLPNVEILRQATSLNAELLRRSGELGTVAPGAFADLIVVDGDPVADIGVLSGQGERIALVVKRGRTYRPTCWGGPFRPVAEETSDASPGGNSSSNRTSRRDRR